MADQQDDTRDLTAGIDVTDLDATGLLVGKVGDDEVLLVRGASGLFAIGATCTHSGAPLAQGIVVGDTVRCPWHHACFDTRGGTATAAPAFKALDRWTVDERDGRAFVRAKANAAPGRANNPTPPRIVIVGAGAGGVAAADALTREGARSRVTLIGNEREPPYDRTMLSKHFLAGKAGNEDLVMKVDDLHARGVDVRRGVVATRIEPEAKQVVLEDGTVLPYDKLILATGAEPRTLPVPGAELPHVVTLRSAADARVLLDHVASSPRVVVIGSSFIGMEAAAALRDQGVDVTVVSPELHPFARTLGPALSDAIMAVHRRHGTAFRLGREVVRIEPDRVELDDGTLLPADVVLVGVGVSPRIALAEQAGLAIDDGVTVDERLRTSHHDIFAVGDIARWPDPHSGTAIRVEHWAVAQRQGQIAALNALGAGLRYDVVPFFWTMHFDFSVRLVGYAADWDEIATEGDASAKDAVLRFRKNGRDIAVATVERDRDNLLAELEMERRLGQTSAALPST